MTTENDELIERLRTTPPNVLKEREAADALQAIQAERNKLIEDLQDERTRGLRLLDDAKDWQQELAKIKADFVHLQIERDALQSKLDALEKQEPVTYARRDQLQKTRIYSHLCDLGPYPRADKVPLYLTAGAAQPVSTVVPVANIDAVMGQVQVFASAWSLVGSRFDFGQAVDDAKLAEAELRAMLTTAPPPPASAAAPVDSGRYYKLRRWMSSNVKEGWTEVEHMGAVAKCILDKP